uniref:Uncharacterized protein n=1 Tax=Anguilla anguilla TaxID=7936 RepID=A0A0E9TWK9_ANGAN
MPLLRIFTEAFRMLEAFVFNWRPVSGLNCITLL